MAGNLFNGNIEDEPHSDFKPEIADPGTFTKEGEVVDTTNGKRWMVRTNRLITTRWYVRDTMVGVDVNG